MPRRNSEFTWLDGLFVNADQLRDILGDFNGVTYYEFSRKTDSERVCFSKEVSSKDQGDFFKNFHHKDLLEFQFVLKIENKLSSYTYFKGNNIFLK